MKKWFWGGLAGLLVVEVLRVWFVMPLPGSQRIQSLDAAYTIHTWRWALRVACLLAIVVGVRAAFRIRKRHWWLPVLGLLLVAAVVGFVDLAMPADRMFEPPHQLVFAQRDKNTVEENAIVIGVERNGEAKAYPIRFLVYHHQVRDSIGGEPVLVTYCSVCRTGRVFEPKVDGKLVAFRLVGMDHWNAMFEDGPTGSWWRQATGEAVAGPLRGQTLPEVESKQASLAEWLHLHPASLVMQPDPESSSRYDTFGRFERGESVSAFTGTNHGSWQEKSWVVGITLDGKSKAYDWNRLERRRVLNDTIGGVPIVLALSKDAASFVAFERPSRPGHFTIDDDVLTADGRSYDFEGRDLSDASHRLKPVQAHQEFWHSWQTFHPDTARQGE